MQQHLSAAILRKIDYSLFRGSRGSWGASKGRPISAGQAIYGISGLPQMPAQPVLKKKRSAFPASPEALFVMEIHTSLWPGM
jgi:hypothetical protein